MVSGAFNRTRPRIGMIGLLAACVAGVFAAAAPALAATPGSGTVSDTSTSVQWSAGPFAAPNVTGTTGGVTCGPQLCDDFALHVSTPSGYGDTHQLTIKVGWANAAADFDVCLLDHSGAVVASSASSADPEVMVVPPTSCCLGLEVLAMIVLLPAAAALGGLFTWLRH